MRGVKRIVADAGSTAIVAAAGLFAVCVSVGHAVPTQPGPPDEALTTDSTSAASDAAPQASVERDRALLAAAVRPGPQAPEVHWSDAGDAVSSWAAPALGGIERFNDHYGSRLDFKVTQQGGHRFAQVQIALGAPEREPVAVKSEPVRLGGAPAPRPILKKKAHWYLFAAGGSNAIGMNLLRDQSGELKRAGWTFEHLAAVGTGQIGVGWRKGPVQASVGLVEQQLSSYGHTIHDRFVAFTISITGQGVRSNGGNRTWLTNDDHYRGRYAEH